MDEVWKPIPRFNRYQVSNLGRVKSDKTILRSRNMGAGYRAVTLYENGAHHRYVHRLVAFAFLGDGPDGAEINHKDGDKTNNALSNLEYCTHKQNIAHAWSAKLLPQPPVMLGSKHPRASINEKQAATILQLVANGIGNAEISRRLNISKWTVESVKYRRCWRHIPMPQRQ